MFNIYVKVRNKIKYSVFVNNLHGIKNIHQSMCYGQSVELI